ncbi:amino acid aminotransferase [Pseudoruegeria sp. SK021]|uniref:amino acid aminotransferase n=1 Tax=Pseudoruegeria sp. SK021 TaxID=1933035 RepID=UPI000A256429|nr:amino acid aminotransferase [Pseudoruegeria sp. SK021]OSP55734.1 aromatic amino acid aminotransferase [Pseudoruegeria sp. SK021]
MFSEIKAPEGDRLLALMQAFRADPNPRKVDLGVGVYMDDSGTVPILSSVKIAEQRLLETETTKTYVGPLGDPTFAAAVQEMLLGASSPLLSSGRTRTIQTPGGSGALRIAADLIHANAPDATIWLSTPTWINHGPIHASAGNRARPYPYFNPADGSLDFDGMMACLDGDARPGDVVLLHACCHNPTGLDLGDDHWRELTALMARKALIPMIDCAYQGFGAGLDADVAGLRHMAEALPEVLIATSYSKNFGLYRERTGALTLIAKTPDHATAATAALGPIVRTSYSMPPSHGAQIVALIWTDPTLRQQWLEELAGMRDRIVGLRHRLRTTLEQHQIGRDFSFLTSQRGMFSYTGFTPDDIQTLRARHAIYIASDGRISIPGVNDRNIGYLCEQIAAVLSADKPR